jgi:hypothetical protein
MLFTFYFIISNVSMPLSFLLLPCFYRSLLAPDMIAVHEKTRIAFFSGMNDPEE